jgi:hypothetical protein
MVRIEPFMVETNPFSENGGGDVIGCCWRIRCRLQFNHVPIGEVEQCRGFGENLVRVVIVNPGTERDYHEELFFVLPPIMKTGEFQFENDIRFGDVLTHQYNATGEFRILYL